MANPSQDIFAEDRQSLWVLTFSPAIWAHFLASYIAAAIWDWLLWR